MLRSLLILLFLEIAWAQDGPVVDLETLRRRVKESSPAVAIARAKLADYIALFEEAYFAWTPSLKIDALLAPLPERKLLRECILGEDGASGLPLVGPCPGQNIEDNDVITADTEIGILVKANARLTFPIYTFGKIDSAQRAARAGVAIGHATVEATQAELDYLVKKAYYGAQMASSALDIIEDGRRRMHKAKAQIEKELEKESGRFTSNDLRKLLVDQAEIEVGYLETESLRQVAWEALRIAGGFAPGEVFSLDSLKLRAVKIEPRLRESYMEMAFSSYPVLRALEQAVKARRAQVEMARADFYPNVALVGGFGFAKGTTAEDSPDPFANDSYNTLSWGVVLGAEWKMNFAERLSDLRQAEADLAKQRAELETKQQQLQLDVTEQVAKMERYSKELDVREVATKAAKGWLISNSMNFGLGLVSTSELLSSLVAYSKAQLKLYQSIYEYNLSVAKLSQTVGMELSVK